MGHEDKLPALPAPRPGPGSTPPSANPDDLARAMHALARAMAEEDSRAEQPPVPSEEDSLTPDSFTPVGAPRWRSGRDGARPSPPEAGRAGAIANGNAVARPVDHAPRDTTTGRDPLARRITSLHLPQFSIERWMRSLDRRGEILPDDLPAALAIEGPHGPVIHAATRAAGLAGVHKGARVVDMRALCPDLRIEYADIAGDRMALQRLMLWTRRWCPWTALDGDAGLVMDTTGSDHLWGGEAAMLRDIEEKLSHLGLSADLATAPTHGAAWALARFGGVRDCCPPERLAARMAPLAARALRLDADTVLLLQRLGLNTVGDLAAVPRLSLARRFANAAAAQNPLHRLDQMMGRTPEPVDSPDDPPRFAVEARLPEPIEDPTPHLPALARTLCAGLEAHGFGARRIALTIYRTDGEIARLDVATARPTRDWQHMARLFDGKLDRIDPGYGFDLVTLDATVVEDMAQVQTRLDGGADDGAEIAKLADRLSARFGGQAIRHPVVRESHLPERREDWHPVTGPRAHVLAPAPQPRPFRLLEHPEEIRVLYAVPEGPPAQFVWRKQTHRVVRFAGPERIAPEWWRDRPGTRLRDYYHIEDHASRRFWLYRDGVLGDRRGDGPDWFVHGIHG